MTMQKIYRGELPKPDSRGYWRPEVGGKRFNIGHRNEISEGEAKRRLKALRDLFQLHCERHETNEWQDWVLDQARELARGNRVIDWKIDDVDLHLEAAIVEEYKALGFMVRESDPELLAKGRQQLTKWVEQQVQEKVTKAIAEAKDELLHVLGPLGNNSAQTPEVESYETKTLHDALTAYSKHLEATGNRDEEGNLTARVSKCQDRLKYHREHLKDIPLWQLNLAKIEEHAAYWRNRPKTKKGGPCSDVHASDMGKEMSRFLRWLDKTPEFNWTMPKGGNEVKRTPVRLPQDDRKEAFQTITKETYSPEELAILVRHTDGIGRAVIGVSVNCGFGQSEVGQWVTRGYLLNVVHPHADRLGLQSTTKDSWIVGNRPKTGIYSEHLLWPEVASSVAPFLDGREVLPITRMGNPWYRRHSKNPQAKFTKWWKDLLDRVEKTDKTFRRLPFGSLRDTFPDVLRAKYDDKLASLALHHGSLSDDQLLKCYANLPFAQLFEATRELHEFYKPFLDELVK